MAGGRLYLPRMPARLKLIMQRSVRMIEKVQMWIAWKMPRWLVKWCAVRLMANATQGEYCHQIVPNLSAIDALKRW